MRIAVDRPITRWNYSFQIVSSQKTDGVSELVHAEENLDPTELAWAFTMGGDEDRADYERPVGPAVNDKPVNGYVNGNGNIDGAANGNGFLNGDANANANGKIPRGQFGIDTDTHKRPTPTPGNLYLRTERQTLRRLPRTGAIAFTIRVYQTRVDELAEEPGVPGRMASAIRSWPEDVARYARSPFHSLVFVFVFVLYFRFLIFPERASRTHFVVRCY